MINPQQAMESITPLTPDVASLGRFTLSPPNYSNGHVNHNINLLSIKERDLNYSLDLFYNYSGFKPKEDASTVGLGWGLTEGTIIRIVKHVPDEQLSLIKKFDDLVGDPSEDMRLGECGLEQTNCDRNENPYSGGLSFAMQPFSFTLNRLYYKLYDGQPDLYIYNFGGHSGKFIWVNDAAIKLDFDDVRIERTQIGTSNSFEFKMTTPEGIQYRFNEMDRTINNVSQATTAVGCNNSVIETYRESDYPTTWRLTEMKSNVTKTTINFNYNSNYSTQVKDINQITSVTLLALQNVDNIYRFGSYELDESYQKSTIHSFFLEEIVSDHYKIKFVTKTRKDGGQNRLEEIQLLNKADLLNPIRTVKFNQDYFGDVGNPRTCWLKLRKVNIEGQGNHQGYEFTYLKESQNLFVNKDGLSIDHWGYFNRAINNSLIPYSLKTVIDSYVSGFYIGLPYANREADFEGAKSYALETTRFPTGGFSKVSYEPAGVGIRVKEIENFDMGKSVHKYYDYHEQNVYFPPVYYEPTQHYEVQCCFNFSSQMNTRFITFSGYAASSKDFITRPDNFYENVTELIGSPDGKGGRTEYRYTRIFGYNNDKVLMVSQSDLKYGSTVPIKSVEYSYSPELLSSMEYWQIPELQSTNILSGGPCHMTPLCCPTDDLDNRKYNLGIFTASRGQIDALWFRLNQKTEILDGVRTVTQFEYRLDESNRPRHTNPISTTSTLSTGDVKKMEMYYPGDTNPDNVLEKIGHPVMWDPSVSDYKYFFGPVVMTKSFINNQLIAREKTDYTYDNIRGYVLRSSYESLPKGKESDKIVWTFKYDDKTNLIEIGKTYDKPISFLWGYNGTVPIIKAENVTSDQLKTAVANTTSNIEQLLIDIGDMSTMTQRQVWKTFSNQLRSNLPALSIVNIYTFWPSSGTTSITDGNGKVLYYSYDEFGRLKLIQNDSGSVIKAYSYFTKEN